MLPENVHPLVVLLTCSRTFLRPGDIWALPHNPCLSTVTAPNPLSRSLLLGSWRPLQHSKSISMAQVAQASTGGVVAGSGASPVCPAGVIMFVSILIVLHRRTLVQTGLWPTRNPPLGIGYGLSSTYRQGTKSTKDFLTCAGVKISWKTRWTKV